MEGFSQVGSLIGPIQVDLPHPRGSGFEFLAARQETGPGRGNVRDRPSMV
jgi:hypothetical protein